MISVHMPVRGWTWWHSLLVFIRYLREWYP